MASLNDQALYHAARLCPLAGVPVWGLVSSYMDGPNVRTWITVFQADFEARNGVAPNALDTYSAALYWSIMTLTSIGYGAMTPENTTERMLRPLHDALWHHLDVRAIGSVAAIATTLDPNTVQYENTMDQCVTHSLLQEHAPMTRPGLQLLRISR